MRLKTWGSHQAVPQCPNLATRPKYPKSLMTPPWAMDEL
eukprot:CAMPEP_0174338530 /NCGR_PEP_ID=MMETSP0810-20121108/23197_1 /TAXON_ID=73025 ORGANISM="Eutreptiella gymnastica-like, Strain CCMP1594" /NCGR_SAMPLE_ID=MMETSP0810 /ASSEMBLY_ACC=CAM_ASM_000659 /LENGTH=38 /DNA_ID= /DNA_START= /DNA_END= /DNA_ORIENTATION=